MDSSVRRCIDKFSEGQVLRTDVHETIRLVRLASEAHQVLNNNFWIESIQTIKQDVGDVISLYTNGYFLAHAIFS